MPIKHIFFDLDHTLWDFEANAEKAYQVCFDKHNITLETKEFMSIYRPINLAYWKAYREERISKEELKRGRLIDAFEALTYPISIDKIDAIATDFLTHLPVFNQPFKGAIEILEYLKQKYTLHIITNGFNEVQIPKMENAKILSYFDQIITAESVGVKKPNPKIFLHAMLLAGAEPHNSIMIGDSLEADIEGAKHIGMQAIHFKPSEKQAFKENNEITNLIEIKNYL